MAQTEEGMQAAGALRAASPQLPTRVTVFNPSVRYTVREENNRCAVLAGGTLVTMSVSMSVKAPE